MRQLVVLFHPTETTMSKGGRHSEVFRVEKELFRVEIAPFSTRPQGREGETRSISILIIYGSLYNTGDSPPRSLEGGWKRTPFPPEMDPFPPEKGETHER